MKFDIILCGVGGQGVLSLAAIIAKASLENNLKVRQSEVHGMSQRGGDVLANLRISDEEIQGDLIPKGEADLVIAMEPMESLRYLDYMNENTKLISEKEQFNNISNYPDLEKIYNKINSLKHSKLIEAKNIAKEVATIRSANMVLIGAAANFIPLENESLKKAIIDIFSRKGEAIVEANLKAFDAGNNL